MGGVTSPSGRVTFSHDVSFSAWGSGGAPQDEAWEGGSEKPESAVRLREEERESHDSPWSTEEDEEEEEAWPDSFSPPPAASSSSWWGVPSGRPAWGASGDRVVSGDPRPDWKGGWNTLTEYLG